MCPKNIEVELTDRAVNRVRECGCDPLEIIHYLYSGEIAVSENFQGFEILVPFKGRLTGTFDKGIFVAESFLSLIHRGKYYSYHSEFSRNQFFVIVSLVRRSGLRRIVVSCTRKVEISLSEFGLTESGKPSIIPISRYTGE